MADESKYLEENYDGDTEQRAAQRAEDIENAKKIAQEVKEVQQRAYEIFEDECIDLIGISGTRYEELMKKSNFFLLKLSAWIRWMKMNSRNSQLESSYGTSTCVDINTGINGNNYFGIKGKEPAGSVTCKTKEEIEGNMVWVIAGFKAYNSMDESIEDHSNLIRRF